MNVDGEHANASLQVVRAEERLTRRTGTPVYMA